jgi:hypothetical protein
VHLARHRRKGGCSITVSGGVDTEASVLYIFEEHRNRIWNACSTRLDGDDAMILAMNGLEVPDPRFRWDATSMSLFACSSIQQIFTINPSDSVNAHVLSHGIGVTSQVTIQTCQAAGYQLSGAEYACVPIFLLDSTCFTHRPK